MEPTPPTAPPALDVSRAATSAPLPPPLSPLDRLERAPVGGKSPLELFLRDSEPAALLGSFALGVFLGVLIRS